jgi:hypothetical protein
LIIGSAGGGFPPSCATLFPRFYRLPVPLFS